MTNLFIVMALAVSLLSGYVTSEGRDSSGYGVGSNEQTAADSPALGAGVGRDAVIGSGG